MYRLRKMGGDALFSTIEKFNGDRPWGSFLDAGTGANSLKWIQSLPTTNWTAITADNGMLRSLQNDADIRIRSVDSLVIGNWIDDSFCSSLGRYDTILADYLIGAVEGFAPYEQDNILNKLRHHLNPGGRLFIIGMNPIPDHAPQAEIVGEVRRARDAAILLAGHKPYREFPVDWMKRHLSQGGFTVTQERKFTILHTAESVTRQIRVGQSKLTLMPSAVSSGMSAYLSELEQRVAAVMKSSVSNRIPLSFDYVMEAVLINSNTDSSSSSSSNSISNSSSSSSVFSCMPNSNVSAMEGRLPAGSMDLDCAIQVLMDREDNMTKGEPSN